MLAARCVRPDSKVFCVDSVTLDTVTLQQLRDAVRVRSKHIEV